LGFQLNIIAPKVLATAFSATRNTAPGNAFAPLPADTCTNTDAGGVDAARQARFANGLQIFPGGFPIFKGNTLVGGIGVSGDGVDQDDMVGYLGVINGATRLSPASNARPFASTNRRADGLSNGGQQLKYIQCPQTPFNDTNETNVCP
jgi:hypothetical protein